MNAQNGIVELVFLLDVSGSMEPLKKDTVTGFNTVLQVQKQENDSKKVYVSTVLFNEHSRVIHNRESIERVSYMTLFDYVPHGRTALYDAVGSAIRHINVVHLNSPVEVRPEKTLFVIMTDGFENASRYYMASDVACMIECQKRLGWEFLFLAANIDSVHEAKKMGIEQERAISWRADMQGEREVFNGVSRCVGRWRGNRGYNRKEDFGDVDNDFENRNTIVNNGDDTEN
jgi:uncharacterized protein YegL